MNRAPVVSSNIRSVGHDGATLHVEFANGTVYEYPNVSPEEHAALVGATSIGAHFNKHLRGRACTKLAPEPVTESPF